MAADAPFAHATFALAQSGAVQAASPRDLTSGSLDVLVPIALFATLLGFGALAFRFQQKKNRMLHDTLRLTIEKGQAIPADLWRLGQPTRPGDLRYGLVCIALGIGLAAYGWQSRQIDWTIGIVPFLVGCAFLIVWRIESNRNGRG